jgi:hypothetical protein
MFSQKINLYILVNTGIKGERMLYEIEAKMQKGKNGISFYYRKGVLFY